MKKVIPITRCNVSLYEKRIIIDKSSNEVIIESKGFFGGSEARYSINKIEGVVVRSVQNLIVEHNTHYDSYPISFVGINRKPLCNSDDLSYSVTLATKIATALDVPLVQEFEGSITASSPKALKTTLIEQLKEDPDLDDVVKNATHLKKRVWYRIQGLKTEVPMGVGDFWGSIFFFILMLASLYLPFSFYKYNTFDGVIMALPIWFFGSVYIALRFGSTKITVSKDILSIEQGLIGRKKTCYLKDIMSIYLLSDKISILGRKDNLEISVPDLYKEKQYLINVLIYMIQRQVIKHYKVNI